MYELMYLSKYVCEEWLYHIDFRSRGKDGSGRQEQGRVHTDRLNHLNILHTYIQIQNIAMINSVSFTTSTFITYQYLLLLDEHVDEDKLVQSAHVVEVVLLQQRTSVQIVVRSKLRSVDSISQNAVHLYSF